MPYCLKCGAEIKNGSLCKSCAIEILTKMAEGPVRSAGRDFEWRVTKYIEGLLKELKISDKLIVFRDYDVRGFAGTNYKVDIVVQDKYEGKIRVIMECATINEDIRNAYQYFDKMARDYTKLSDILRYLRNKVSNLEAFEVVNRPALEWESPKVDYKLLFGTIGVNYVVFDKNGCKNIAEVLSKLF